MLPLARALTEAEAAKWATHIASSYHQGAAATAVEEEDMHAGRRRSWPAYLTTSWWEGEVLDEVDSALAARPASPIWGSTHGDGQQRAATDFSTELLGDDEGILGVGKLPDKRSTELLDMLDIPCVTTTDECTLEAGAGIVIDEISEASPADLPEHPVFEGECFWTDGCYAF